MRTWKPSGSRLASHGFAPLAALLAASSPAAELHLLTYGVPSVLGTQGNRHAQADRYSVSDDGRHVVFATASNNLSDDDRGEHTDIYIADTLAGSVTRLSRRADGGEPNGNSLSAAISGDGRWVVYVSQATDIVTTPAVAGRGVYLVDRVSGQTRLLTPPVLPSPQAWPAQLSGLAIAADGSRVAFVSDANLDARDTDSAGDLYVWTRASGALELASLDAVGVPLAGVVDATSPALSADGGQVSFSMRTIASIPDEGGVFVRDLQTGSIDRVSGPPSVLTQSHTGLSGDARYVVFSTYESLLPGDTNGESDTYLFDRTTRQFELVSVSDGGMPGNDRSFGAAISADGRYVAFQSSATNFEAGVSGLQLWRRDRTAGTTTRITHPPGGAAAAPWYDVPAMSGATGRIVFSSSVEGLVDGDDNQRSDVFAVDPDGSTRRVGQSGVPRLAGATAGHYFDMNTGRAFPLGDSGAVVLATTADNLGPLRAAGVHRVDIAGAPPAPVPLDVLPAYPGWPIALMLAGASVDGSELLIRREPFDFTGGWGPAPLPAEPWDLWRIGTGGAMRLDVPAAVGNGARTTQALLSDDGRHAQFISLAAPDGVLIQPWRLFLHDAQTGLLTRIDTNAQGIPADQPIQPRSGLSRNGRYSVFVTEAGNLVANDADGSPDLFLRDNQTAQLTRLRHPQTDAPLVAPSTNNRDAIAVSDDGQHIAFVDSAGANGGSRVLRLLDRTAQTLVDVCGDGMATPSHCTEPTMSADGRVLVFTSAHSLLPIDDDDSSDVYSFLPAFGALRLESIDADGRSGYGPRHAPQVSASGESLTFRARGGGWRTAPQITGDTDWLFTRVAGDAIHADGFESPGQ